MVLQEVGKYSVEPFALERILELEYVKTVNEHAKLYVRGILKEGEEDSLIRQQWDDMPVKLIQAGVTLFCGVAADVGVICENGVYYLEAEALSWTVKLDRVEKKRSFQEHGRGYDSIVNQIAAEFGGLAKCVAPAKQIENLLLQYRETDWEFLKRIASHSNSVLVPDPAEEKPAFSFGVADGESYVEETEKADFSIRKNVTRYRQLSQSEEISYQEEDAIEYTIRTEFATLEIGDKVSIKGKKLYVREVRMSLKDSVFLCTCVATTKAGISAPRMAHPHISGLTLTGEVLKIINYRLKVHLAIDETQDEGTAYEFPYATGYTTEGDTGWYMMPEKGDSVEIVFPTEDENTAYAAQSVRRGETDRTNDPEIKYIRTVNGIEIQMNKTEIVITADDWLTFMDLNKKDGVSIFTIEEVNVLSAKNISLATLKDISMVCNGNFNLQVGKKMTVNAKELIDVANKENIVHMEPNKGIEMKAKKPIKISTQDKMNLESKKMFTANSADEMKINSKKNLNILSKNKMIWTASKALQENCKGSAIRIDGNVTIKAMLIKEN